MGLQTKLETYQIIRSSPSFQLPKLAAALESFSPCEEQSWVFIDPALFCIIYFLVQMQSSNDTVQSYRECASVRLLLFSTLHHKRRCRFRVPEDGTNIVQFPRIAQHQAVVPFAWETNLFQKRIITASNNEGVDDLLPSFVRPHIKSGTNP